MKKRIISAMLACAMICGAFWLTGCGTEEDKTDDTENNTSVQPVSDEDNTADETDAVEESEADARLSVTDGLPEDLSFGGEDFCVWVTDRYRYEIIVDDITGDVCNDATFERNSKIESQYDVKITSRVTEMDSDDAMDRQPTEMKTSIMSGDDEFDMAAVMVWKTGGLIMGDYLRSWNDVQYINRDNVWWPKEANEAFTVNGRQYAAVTDLSVTTLQLAYGILFNKQLAENYDIEDLYTVVDEGRWTIDYLAEKAAAVYVDTNGNGTRDMDDTYGFVGDEVTGLDVWPAAFDIPLIAANDSGELEVVANSEKMVSGLEKILNLYYNNEGSYKVYYWEKYDMFKANKSLFIAARLITLYNELRDMDVDFGVIPYPKYDENQTKYYGNCVDNYSVFVIPANGSDTAITGAMLEAMSCENYRTVIPAYYDIALTSKYTRDERSVDMLDLIMAGRHYDISILHNDTIPQLSYLFRNLVVSNNPDFASTYKSMQTVFNKSLKKVVEKYAD